ncbi:MAG: hypothetical protein K6D38_06140 [Pseudobutyrivibrio sp.]|nr:hypothetical protein [Pseudobutyrivibrio sp.]
MVEQGDIIKVEGIKGTAAVISKTGYNQSGCILACPIIAKRTRSSFLVEFPFEGDIRYIASDSVKQLDISTRGYRVVGQVPLSALIVVIDMINAIIELF